MTTTTLPTQPKRNFRHEMNHMNPAAIHSALGDIVYDLINNLNAVQADLAALTTKYDALLAHMDTANVAGLGNANVATYTPAAPTAAQVLLPENRTEQR